VGTLAASDSNSGDVPIYSLVNSADGRFKIVGNQLLVDNGFKLDFEQARSHLVTVQITDQGGLSHLQDFVINVGDVTPEFTAGSAFADVFKGGVGKDTLGGGAGDDKLWGGAGKDLLTGGVGKDIFVFDTKLNKKTNLDKIADFNVKDDTIWLDNAIFTKLGKKGSELAPAKLNKAFFTIGDKAKDANDYLVYDKLKGALYYDSDGSGAKAAVEIATLKKNLKMTLKDFFII
jgi:Ca2+-binding RTX toxin-like protein